VKLNLNIFSIILVFHRIMFRLLVTPNVVPRSPVLVTLMTEAIRYSETLVLTRAAQRNIPDDVILFCSVVQLQILKGHFLRRILDIPLWSML
jgi:hypothetical protein